MRPPGTAVEHVATAELRLVRPLRVERRLHEDLKEATEEEGRGGHPQVLGGCGKRLQRQALRGGRATGMGEIHNLMCK